MTEISVIIPCYNSEKFAESNILKINKKVKKFFKKIEYIIINDGSKDKTLQELRKVKIKLKKVKIINFKKNFGKSYGIKKAIQTAKGKKILFYDSDIPYFDFFENFLSKLKFHELVIINRRHKKSKIIFKKKSIKIFLRFLIGNFISLINYYFFKIKVIDTQAGLKGFKNSLALKKKKFISKRFFLDIELIEFFDKRNIYPISIPVRAQGVDKESTIKFFDFRKNLELIIEYLKVVKIL